MKLSSAVTSAKAALVAALAVAACGLSTGHAAAQSANLPSYASGEESIRGRISSIDGKYSLKLRDDRGFIDAVRLHDGTIINPTGLRLSPGQSVTIHGYNSGNTFNANEVDTGYAVYGLPAAPYPVYGLGYPYGPYPAFGLGIRYGGFGFRGWY
jgi:hypothetical protein